MKLNETATVPARVDRGTIVLIVETKDKEYVFEHWDKELNRVSHFSINANCSMLLILLHHHLVQK